MKPLQAIAMGLVVVFLSASINGYDLLAGPVGWLLVLLGLRRLPPQVPHLSLVVGLGWLAGLVSVPLWFPAVVRTIADTDASLTWATDLPQILFAAALAHVLGLHAAAAGDHRSAQWLTRNRTLTLIVGVLPVLVFGGGFAGLDAPSLIAAGLVALMLVYLLFLYSNRPWANNPARSESENVTNPPPGP